MTPGSARAAADAGVDFVSVGAITHSIRAIDIALDVDPAAPKNSKKKISLKVKRKSGRTKKGISSKVKRARLPARHR
jgi:hypothetical protein